MKKAVVYVRCAAVEQDGQNVAEQLNKLKDYAKQNNYQITKEYVDAGQGGGNLLRPAMTELRKDMEKKKFDTVIATDTSRLSRQVVDYQILRSLFKKHGVKIVYTDYKFDDSPMGTLMEGMVAIFYEYESELLKRRVKEKIKWSEKAKTPSLEAKRSLATK